MNVNEPSNYPFFWLDEVVEVTLNPARTNLKTLSPDLLQTIRERLPQEIDRIAARLKEQAFCIYSFDQVSVVAGHYDQAISDLIRQVQNNLPQIKQFKAIVYIAELIISLLQHLEDSIHRRLPGYPDNEISIPSSQPGPAKVKRTIFKLLCKLSVDQLGLILKAADDLKLVVARSLSQVFKTIVPFLSTENQKDISWESMRSSTYHPEEIDKQAAITALEKMIAKIREYR